MKGEIRTGELVEGEKDKKIWNNCFRKLSVTCIHYLKCFSPRDPQIPKGPQKPIKDSAGQKIQLITVNPVMALFFLFFFNYS